MSKFVRMGLSLSEAVRLTTWRPAQIPHREPQFGTLAPGLCADITVLDWEEVELPLKDSLGDVMVMDRRLVPVLTIRGGQIVERELPS
ncbi:MAG: amidohydrolase family protein [Chloroflexota bacterium]